MKYVGDATRACYYRYMKLYPYQFEPATCEAAWTVEQARAEDLSRYVAEEKFDGQRGLLQIKPMGLNQNFITGRRISVVTGRRTECQDALSFMRDYEFPDSWEDSIFDGEIVGEGISTDVVHQIHLGKAEYRTWDIIRFHSNMCTEWMWAKRHQLLQMLSNHFPPWMKMVETEMDADRCLARVLAKGGEGIVLKRPGAHYGQGWIKVTPIFTYDVVITGYNWSKSEKYGALGWIQSVKIGQYIPDAKGRLSLIDVGSVSGMNEQLRADISSNHKKYIGRVIRIKAKGRLPSLKFRMPRWDCWREDKNAKDCIYTHTKPA